jgi:hypothetical protein
MFFLEKRTTKRLRKNKLQNPKGWGGRGKLGFPANLK